MTAKDIFISKLTQTLISLISVSDRDWETLLRYTIEDGDRVDDEIEICHLENNKRNLSFHIDSPKTIKFFGHEEIADASELTILQRTNSPKILTNNDDEYGKPVNKIEDEDYSNGKETLRSLSRKSTISNVKYPEYANAGPLYAGISIPELLKVVTQQYPDTMDDYLDEGVASATAMLAARLPYDIVSSVCSSCGQSLGSMASEEGPRPESQCSSLYHRLLSMVIEQAQKMRRSRESSPGRNLGTAHSDARHVTPLESQDFNLPKRNLPVDRRQSAQPELTQSSSKSTLEVSLEGTAHNLEDIELLARNVISYRLSSAIFMKLGWTKNCGSELQQQC
uniref:Uncharacterized protein n=2 Tax=Schistocephalus solidus TaxID=70667 RepID=A0A0V0J2T0_SCHSO